MSDICYTRMMNTYTVRPAIKKDIDALVPLQKEMAAYHHALDSIWSKGARDNAVWRKMLLGLLRRGKQFSFLVLECNGKVVGYATAEIKDASPVYAVTQLGHIGSVYVQKQYRKCGLTSMAMEYFDEWFKKNKVSWVTLQVDAGNPLGTKAWESLGFADWRLELRKKI